MGMGIKPRTWPRIRRPAHSRASRGARPDQRPPPRRDRTDARQERRQCGAAFHNVARAAARDDAKILYSLSFLPFISVEDSGRRACRVAAQDDARPSNEGLLFRQVFFNLFLLAET